MEEQVKKAEEITSLANRETRWGAVSAFGGDPDDLLKVGRKCPARAERSFSQVYQCSLMAVLCPSLHILDNVTIVHAPPGCLGTASLLTTFVRVGYIERGVKPENPHVITTNFDEHGAIHGGVDALREAILEADRRYGPKLITVLATCVSAIVGDDINGIIADIQKEVKATVIPIHCEGFKSDVIGSGWDDYYFALLKYVVKEPKKRRADTLNLFNVPTNSRKDEAEIERLLEKLGIKVNTITHFCKTEAIERASESAGSAALCSVSSIYLLEKFKERWDIPYVLGYPSSFEYTDKWLREVGALFGREKETEALIRKEHRALSGQLKSLREELKGKSAYISANMPRTLAVQSVIEELGMRVVGVTGYEYEDVWGAGYLQNLIGRCGNFPINVGNYQIFEQANLLEREKPDVYIADFEPIAWAARQGIPTYTIHDFVALHYGYRGVVEFGRHLANVLRNPSFFQKLSSFANLPYRKSWYSSDPFKYIKNGGKK